MEVMEFYLGYLKLYLGYLKWLSAALNMPANLEN